MLSELCVDTSQEGKDPAGTMSFQGTVHVQVQSCEKCDWKLQATGMQAEVKCKIEKNINSEGERKKKDQASFWQSTLGLRLLIRRMFPGVGFHHEKFALLCCKRSCYMEMLDFLRVLNIQVGSLGRAGVVKWTNHKKFADGYACSLCTRN